MAKFYITEKSKDDAAIKRLAETLISYGFTQEQISAVVAFCRDAAENDRLYRIANGGGREMPVESNSRQGKTRKEKRRASYYATYIRKTVSAARRVNKDFFEVVIPVNKNGFVGYWNLEDRGGVLYVRKSGVEVMRGGRLNEF